MFEPPVPPRPGLPRSFSSSALVERLRGHWDDPRVRVGALLLAALITGFAWYQLGISGSASAGSSAPTTSTGGTTATTSDASASGTSETPGSGGTSSASGSGSSGGVVVVHVAGAVVHPGVVRLHAGDRVVDAIAAAGGGVPGADLDRLNLAAKLVDGQRVAVGLVGAPAPVETGSDTATADGGDGTPAGPINLNTATALQLEELPGIGPSLAASIIAEREKLGGFKSVGQLQDVRGIGELRFADIKDLVSV
jgi:competence protein ComEA